MESINRISPSLQIGDSRLKDKSYLLSDLLKYIKEAVDTTTICWLSLSQRCVQTLTRPPRALGPSGINRQTVATVPSCYRRYASNTSSTTSTASSGRRNSAPTASTDATPRRRRQHRRHSLNSSQKEVELLGLAGFEQLLRAKPDPTCLWDLASKKDLVLTKSIHTVGEPDKESFNLLNYFSFTF